MSIDQISLQFIDYTKAPLHETLASLPPSPKFHVFLEAVGIADPSLFTQSPAYLAPNGIFLSVGPQPGLSLDGVAMAVKMLWELLLRPTWLGGTNRSFKVIQLTYTKPSLDALAKLLAEGAYLC